jgi:hypothetical protein
MARRANGEQREAKTNGPRVSVAKVGRTVGPTNGRSEAHAEDYDQLHQQIAELAFLLYERSGFQDGKALEHWLEAERQVKGLRGQAA